MTLYCGISFESRDQFLSHLKHNHPDFYSNRLFNCPLPGCKNLPSKYQSSPYQLWKHFSEDHKHFSSTKKYNILYEYDVNEKTIQ